MRQIAAISAGIIGAPEQRARDTMRVTQGRMGPVITWIALLAGTLIVAAAYASASVAGAEPTHYHLFWAGVLLVVAVFCLRLCGAGVPRNERLALIAVFGLFNYLPKYLRTPDGPLFHDELAHWRQSEMVFNTGKLFLPNPTVYISQFFPGLQSMTVALRELTGLSTFQIGSILIACTHVVALMGIFVIAERITYSAQAAGIAAFVYGLNPGIMFFDSQYSYESVALVFVIWTLVAAINVQDALHNRPRQLAWFLTGLLLASVCVVTHHLSSYILIIILWLMTAVTWFRARRGADVGENAWYTGIFTFIVTLEALAWLLLVAPDVLAYMGKPIGDAFHQATLLFQHRRQARTLFAQSTTPLYEHVSAFLSPLIALVGAVFGLPLLRRGNLRPAPELSQNLLRLTRRARPRSSAGIALALFGLLYFPSIPVILTGAGSEGARRSWTFSYIGLSILVTPALVWFLRRLGAERLHVRILGRAAVAALLSVVLVGNVSMHVNELYRFPGPYIFGSDTRSITPELLGVTQWLRATQGTGKHVVADRYASQVLSSFGLEWTPLAAPGFPVWQVYFDSRPSEELLRELRVSNYLYLVVDERMARYTPYLGAYFDDSEPESGTRSLPLARATIDKFEALPWAIKIYQSDNYAVYRLNYAALNLPWTSAGGSGGGP